MKNRWRDVVFGEERRLEPSHFIFKCVNAIVEKRYDCWRRIVYSSFGEKLPNVWKRMMERDRFLFMARSQESPLVGLYEVVDADHAEKPVIVMIMSFDLENMSASVDLLCTDPEFSTKRPVLSGRLVNGCVAAIDNMFQELAPIYASTMVFADNESFNKLIERIRGRRRASLSHYMLIGSNDLATRQGVTIWDKLYE